MISENFNKLFEAAKKVRESAHVPYSNFKVGAALLVEIAFADKDFDESEQDSLKKSLMECYKISEEEINEIIEDAEITVKESTSLYGYTRIVNDEFEYTNKLDLLRNMWKIAYADGNLDKYEEHLIRKTSDLIHISHSDYIKIKLEVRDN